LCLCLRMSLVRASCLLVPASSTSDIYTLSLHDALPISPKPLQERVLEPGAYGRRVFSSVFQVCACLAPHSAAIVPAASAPNPDLDRKSTRLNSSHGSISYAVFCLKKKK